MKQAIAAIGLVALAGCASPPPPPTVSEQGGTVAPAPGPDRRVGVAVGTNGSAVAVGSGNMTVGVSTGTRIGRGGRTGVGWWF